jgi:hypothetical protein
MRKVEKDLLSHPKIALSAPFVIVRSACRKGVALILTVGILALMTLIGTSFAMNMMMDFKSARNFYNVTRAKYFAEAGINRAIAELLYGNEGFVSDAVDSSTETWAGSDVFTTNIGSGGYTVNKIYDCAGQIYINDANPNLRTILENLAIAAGLAASDGDAIFDNRGTGYTTKEEVGSIPGFTQVKYSAIKNHITICAYVDPDVIGTTSSYPASPRAPVNVNTASREVLIAVLTGVSDGANTMTSARAASLADHLVNNRPYAAYDQLWSALLSAETLGYIADGDAAVVMANANPNTGLMRANPNYSWRYKHVSKGDPADSSGYDANGAPFAVDKTMLTAYTTEFSFNSGGYYEINATGFVNDASGSRIAAKSLQAVVKLFDILRQTTQAQFAGGTINNTELYPEYYQASSGVSPATYDGQIMLTTRKETAPSGNPHFKIDYADKANHLNADSAGGDAQRYDSGVTNAAPREAGITTSPYGNLMPDGMFLPRDEPKVINWFYPENNIQANIGSIEVWVKPNFYQRWATFPDHSPRSKDAGKIWEAQTNDYDDPVTGKHWEWENSAMDMYIARAPSQTSCNITVRIRGQDRSESKISYWLYFSETKSNPWRAGTWHHIAFVWDFNAQHQYLYVDGVKESSNSLSATPYGFIGYRGFQIGCDTNDEESPNVTMDEIRVFPGVVGSSDIGYDYSSGRYYDNGDADFTSSAGNIGAARLGTISWTEHVADMDGNRVITGADIAFDVFDGTNWLGNSAGRSNPAGNPLNVMTGGTNAIKYKAYFLETGDGLLDTPVLDDVTISYQKRAKILYWRDV